MEDRLIGTILCGSCRIVRPRAAGHIVDQIYPPSGRQRSATVTLMQYPTAGLIGTGWVVALGSVVARAVLRMTGARALSAAVFGGALLLLSATGGFIAAGRPVTAAGLLVATVAVGGPLWLRVAGSTTVATLVIAIALPAATLTFPIAGWLPAAFVAPALAAGGSLVAVAGGLMGGLALALALVALQAVAAGLAGASPAAMAAAALLGIPPSLVLLLRAAPSDGDSTPGAAARPARQVSGVLFAALWLTVALLWARAVGLIDDVRLERQAWAWNGASALPLALVPLWMAGPKTGTRRWSAPWAEAIAWILVLAALGMAVAPFPELGLASAAVGVASSVLAYGWARRRASPERWIAATPRPCWRSGSSRALSGPPARLRWRRRRRW